MNRTDQVRAGFSLMELLAVVTILGVIAGVVLPRVVTTSESAKERVCQYNCGQINAAVERYRETTGSWPSTDINELISSLDYFPDGAPLCPVTEQPYRIIVTGDRYRVEGHADGNHAP